MVKIWDLNYTSSKREIFMHYLQGGIDLTLTGALHGFCGYLLGHNLYEGELGSTAAKAFAIAAFTLSTMLSLNKLVTGGKTGNLRTTYYYCKSAIFAVNLTVQIVAFRKLKLIETPGTTGLVAGAILFTLKYIGKAKWPL